MFCWATFGHKMTFNGAVIPLLGNVEITVTAAKLLHIRFPVYAGADNILVLLTASGCQPART
jgi:hypothetical protein